MWRENIQPSKSGLKPCMFINSLQQQFTVSYIKTQDIFHRKHVVTKQIHHEHLFSILIMKIHVPKMNTPKKKYMQINIYLLTCCKKFFDWIFVTFSQAAKWNSTPLMDTGQRERHTTDLSLDKYVYIHLLKWISNHGLFAENTSNNVKI